MKLAHPIFLFFFFVLIFNFAEARSRPDKYEFCDRFGALGLTAIAIVKHPDTSLDNASRISRLQIFSDMDEHFQLLLEYAKKFETAEVIYTQIYDRSKSHCVSNFSAHLDKIRTSSTNVPSNMTKEQFDYCQRFVVLNVLAKFFQDSGKLFLISESMKDTLFTDMIDVADVIKTNALKFSSQKREVWNIAGISFNQCQIMTGAQPR